MPTITDSAKREIRLACDTCFRDDMDGITRAELMAAIKSGWNHIRRVQSYEDSIKVYDDPAETPEGYSVLDWYTHNGQCPECRDEGRELIS